jgi:hypothetical protein
VHTGTGLEGVASLKKNLSNQTEARVAYGLALATRAQSGSARRAEDKGDDEGAPVLLLPPESDLWRQVQEVGLGEDAGAAVPRGSRGGGVRDQDGAEGALLMIWLKTQ